MKTVWYLFYNYIVVPLLYVTLHIIGWFDDKTKRGIKGRKRVFEELIINAASLDKNKPLIWFHSSSLGEFEQAKPIISELKKDNKINILVTFFSPSGYENSKKYPHADLISYIPFDTNFNALRFIKIVSPDLAVIMRYDIWPNMIWAMKRYNVPSFLVDATMNPNSLRTVIGIKNFHKYLFKDITKILTVSQTDAEGFKSFECGDEQVKVVGDTRFDRVYQRSQSAKERNLLKEEILKGKKILIAGSTWEQDEDILLPAFKTLAKYDKDVILVIAPHEPKEFHLENIENEFKDILPTIRFSHLNNYKDEKVIIIDSVGILKTLYFYADAAYIGGSFKQNIHNVLEAAVYGVPLVYGPKIENSQEAIKLRDLKGAFEVKNKNEMYRSLRSLFSNKELRESMGNISYEYVHQNLGATERIVQEIKRYI